MPSNIVAVVGQNANGILAFQSRAFMARLAPYGMRGHIIELYRETWLHELKELVEAGVAFAWGYAGIGAALTSDGRNLWDLLGVPFVSVFADTPYQLPRNHSVAAARVVNGYLYRDWLAVQQQLVRSRQISALLPIGVIPNARRDDMPWSKREHRLVFVKSGEDPEILRSRWPKWGKRLHRVLEDLAGELCRHGTGDITATVLACLDAYGLFLGERKDILIAILFQLDRFVRATRATAIARALGDLPATIIGSGWDHVKEPGIRARYLPAIDASGLYELYANCQWLVNATPNFSTGAHERVLHGFAAKCCIVSDDNDFSRTTLRILPSYRGFEWNDKGLADQLAEIYHDPIPYDDQLQPALDFVEQRHDPLGFIGAVATLSEMTKLIGLEAFVLDGDR